MHSQIHRGISLIVLPLPSERAGERLLFPHSVLSNTPGNLANCPPSPFGEGRGEAVSGVFQAFEIPLQTARYSCSQISLLSLKTGPVTSAVSIGYKGGCKRCPFAMQNMPFYTSKDALLQRKRASFRTRKGVDGKAGRKEIDKNKKQTPKKSGPKPKRRSLPKPLRRRGCERKRWDMGS